MKEVDIQPVDLGLELAQRVQACLTAAPVVFDPPIGDQFAQHRQLRALRPVGHGFLFGPTDPVEAVRQRYQLIFGDGQGKGANVAHVTSPAEALREASTTRVMSASRIVLVAFASTVPCASLRCPS